MRKSIVEICKKYSFAVDPDKKVYEMSVSEKQTLEIVKVLYRGADILILDEPTAVLTPQETEALFKVMRAMKADGKSIVIITHKLHEVLEISDRVAVLRKGEYIGEVETSKTDAQSLSDMMVGHAVTLNIDRPEVGYSVPRLFVKNLTVKDNLGVTRLDNVSFTANSGEILGVAGISGSGQRNCLKQLRDFAGLNPVLPLCMLIRATMKRRNSAVCRGTYSRPRGKPCIRAGGQARNGSCRQHEYTR